MRASATTDRAVLIVTDLGQDLHARARNVVKHAHDLSGLKTRLGSPREYRLGRSEPSPLTLGQFVEPSGGLWRHAVLSYGEMPPLTNGRGYGYAGHLAAFVSIDWPDQAFVRVFRERLLERSTDSVLRRCRVQGRAAR